MLYYANALAGEMEPAANTKDADYDKSESESKNSLFGDSDFRYSVYQGVSFTEDPLAKELNVITTSLKIIKMRTYTDAKFITD